MKINSTNLTKVIRGRHCTKCDVKLTIDNVCLNKLNQYKYNCKLCERARKNANNMALKARIITEYGGKCACCSEDDLIFLSIDHVNNDGSMQRKKLEKIKGHKMTGAAFYSWLKQQNYPKEGYQVLCFNCNFAKHVMGTCPHQA